MNAFLLHAGGIHVNNTRTFPERESDQRLFANKAIVAARADVLYMEYFRTTGLAPVVFIL
jgi:hypothetical protein